jgi:hypothetical protein
MEYLLHEQHRGRTRRLGPHGGNGIAIPRQAPLISIDNSLLARRDRAAMHVGQTAVDQLRKLEQHRCLGAWVGSLPRELRPVRHHLGTLQWGRVGVHWAFVFPYVGRGRGSG